MPRETAAGLRKLVGRRVSETRRSQGLTQEALAEKLDVSPQWLSRVERGYENLTLDTLVRVASKLKVKVIDLMTEGDVDPRLPQRVRPKVRRRG